MFSFDFCMIMDRFEKNEHRIKKQEKIENVLASSKRIS